jgi:hypothetical protein
MYRNLRNPEKAEHYYFRAIEFGEELGAIDTGYYIYSLLNYAILINDRDVYKADEYFEKVRKNTKNKHSANKKALKYLKENKIRKKKLRKEERKRGRRGGN